MSLKYEPSSETGAWVLYISSDEVFSSKPGSFKPDDPPSPRGPEVNPHVFFCFSLELSDTPSL